MDHQIPERTVFFEQAALLDKVEGDVGFLCELVEAFEQSRAAAESGLGAAVAGGDASRLEAEAHSLKGALQNFAGGRVVALAYRLELMGRGAQMDGAAEVLRDLRAEVALVSAYLRDLAERLPKS